MISGNLWRIALAVVCALGAVTLVVAALMTRRRRSRVRVVLSVLLAGALLIIGATPLLINAVQTLTRNPPAPANVVNRAAPVADELVVYGVTDTQGTSDTLVALTARTGAIRWSKVFAGDLVIIRARGPMDVIVEESKVGSSECDIVALRASDGATLWRRALEGAIGGGSQALRQTILPLDATGAAPSPLYVLTAQVSPPVLLPIMRFTALRASDGDVLWQDTSPASMPSRYSNPVVTPSAILFESSLFQQDGVAGHMELVAVDATTGQPSWVATIQQGPNATESDVVADKSAAYVAMYDAANQAQQIEALRLTDGKLLWRVAVDPTNGMLGLTGSGGVMVGTQTALIALDVASGKTIWTLGQTSATGAAGVAVRVDGPPPIANANTLYFMAYTGNTYPQQPMVYAIDATTGATRWTTHALSQVDVMLHWKNGVVYILGGDSGIIALDAGTGAERWRLAESGGLWNPDWTAAPDTVFLGLSIRTPPGRWSFCEGGVLYPFVWALSDADGSVYWRTLIAEGQAYGSTACA
jgi:outer membrane protein assembly factor BamB